MSENQAVDVEMNGGFTDILSQISNPADRKKVKDAMQEMSDSKTRVEAERDLQKEIVNRIHEELGLEKKHFRKLANIYHKQNFLEQRQDNDTIETLYETIVGDGE